MTAATSACGAVPSPSSPAMTPCRSATERFCETSICRACASRESPHRRWRRASSRYSRRAHRSLATDRRDPARDDSSDPRPCAATRRHRGQPWRCHRRERRRSSRSARLAVLLLADVPARRDVAFLALEHDEHRPIGGNLLPDGIRARHVTAQRAERRRLGTRSRTARGSLPDHPPRQRPACRADDGESDRAERRLGSPRSAGVCT